MSESSLPWISATSAQRLIDCPASASLPRAEPPARSPARPSSAGDMAHLAVSRWIRSQIWRGDQDGSKLVGIFDDIVREAGSVICETSRGRATRSRIKVRARDLRKTLLVHGSDVVRSEFRIVNSTEKLFGTLDVLTTDNRRVSVLDLKTNAALDVSGSITPAVRFQLLFYSTLVFLEYGQLPATAEVFSLVDGRHSLPITVDSVENLRSRVREVQIAWSSGRRTARPAEASCKFCPRRLACDPHWITPRVAGDGDSVEGVVIRTSASGAALTSLLLQTPDGEVWVSGVDNTAKSNSEIHIGVRIRMIHVIRSRAAGNIDSKPQLPTFRFRPDTEIAVEHNKN